jgi:hypothetical protein
MPTRSINLKLILPRGDDGAELRQSLWVTHRVLNEAVAEIEAILLLLRGRAYWTGEEDEERHVAQETVRRDALSFARGVQRDNGKEAAGSDEEILQCLQQLYDALVPSVNRDDNGQPLEGNAQAAGGFASPLMDAQSEGFQNIFEKILDPSPAWIAAMAKGTAGWDEASDEWLQGEESQRLQRATGSPPAWVRKVRAKQPWQEAFVADQEKKRREVDGVPTLIRRMKSQLGLLPLMKPPVTSRFAGKPSGLTPWDRLALRLVVAHLLSWESWNHRAADEHAGQLAKVERCRQRAEEFSGLIEALRTYERERHKELKRVAQADDERPYRIGPRAIRGWDRVREAWLGKRGATRDKRLKVLADLQAKLGGRFGDPALFRWLAHEGREPLWRERDPLPALAQLNAQQRVLERKSDHALYTDANARLHPRWIGYEAPGGANLRTYGLEFDGRGTTHLRLPLLAQEDGGLEEKKFDVSTARSGQFTFPRSNDAKGKARRVVYSSAHQEFSAKLGGAELLFSRRHLESRDEQGLCVGDVGPVWFKLVLDVDSQAPAGWLDGRGRVAPPGEVHHFNSGLATKSRHADSLAPGLRVLSVDLGVRTFASCSVFELIEGQPEKGLAFPADPGRGLWAKHERSFLLPLPGETPAAEVLRARSAAYDELGSLRRDLRRVKSVLRLSVVQDNAERAAVLDDLRRTLAETRDAATTVFDPANLDALAEAVNSDPAAWEEAVGRLHHQLEHRLGSRISQWRRATRPRADEPADRAHRRAYAGGKSAWAVEYLDAVRRFLLGWSLHGRQYGQINRADRQRRGTFAVRLLEHLNALKQDRVKAGSDLIVQAARGYLPDRRGWRQAHEPCRLILFEDLARYRFRIDRPRRENSLLMRWNHRQVVREAKMQAELYGIGIEDRIGAGFSSRFHARSGAPGCRTRVVSPEDLESPGIAKQLEFLAQKLSLAPAAFRAGMRVPWEGGPDFATLGAHGELVTIHADLNAAQNLQRRFWTRHADAYRVVALEVQVDGRTCWYPERDGTRLRGALAQIVGGDGYSRLVEALDADGFALERVSRAQWRAATGNRAKSGDETEEDDEGPDVVPEELERGAGSRTFFRDPSGLVLRADRWYEGKVFWSRVERRVAEAIRVAEAVF